MSLIAAGLVVVATITSALTIAMRLHLSSSVQGAALFVHLASLVVGFGAVLTVDWIALLWVLGRRSMADVLRGAENVQAMIWIGYTGLIVSGTFLGPDVASTLTQVKVGLVLLIGWNGLGAMALQRTLGSRQCTRAHLAVGAIAALMSQLAWWGAMLIGFLNTN